MASPDAAPVDLLCCGLATLDLTQYVDQIPAPDQKVVADDALLDVGGPAANAARTAAALGSVTSLVTVLGTTWTAKSVAHRLLADGVTVVDAIPDLTGWQPPVSAITVDRAGRRSVVSTNAGSAPTVTEAPALPDARITLVDGHHLTLAITVARQQRDRGGLVVLDGGSWKPGLEQLLPFVDVAAVSADFRCPAEHEAALQRVPLLAVTSGAQPIRVAPQRGRRSAEAGETLVPVPEVEAVDTLGAGDVLHGALCHELAGRLPVDRTAFVGALRRAAVVASRSCAYRGVLGWARGQPEHAKDEQRQPGAGTPAPTRAAARTGWRPGRSPGCRTRRPG